MNRIKSALFWLVQCTWGLPQNLAGGVAYLLLRKKYKNERFHHSYVTYVSAKNFGGVSLGLFIFMNPDRPEPWVHDTRIHEYGHTIQSLLLGPLYFLVIGIPSMVWCNFPAFIKYRKENNVSYHKLYCESWANNWGLRWSKERFMEPEKMKG